MFPVSFVVVADGLVRRISEHIQHRQPHAVLHEQHTADGPAAAAQNPQRKRQWRGTDAEEGFPLQQVDHV